MSEAFHLYVISFTVGKEAGLALVAANSEKDAFQILKNGGSRYSEGYSLIQTRNIGMSSSCSYGLLLESFVNAKEAYDAIIQATRRYIGPQGDKGEQGDAAGFGEFTASVDPNTGTPGVIVHLSGPDTAKNAHFEFYGIRGEVGPMGPTGPAVPLVNNLETDRSTLGLAASMGVQLKRYIDTLEANANKAVYLGDKIGTVD